MAKYSSIKAKINEKVTTNGRQGVTGSVLNDVLQTMVDSLGADYQFGGLVQPGSFFTAGEQPVVFLATAPGTYTNFGGLVLADGEVALLVWSGSAWSKQIPDIATKTEVSQLGQKISGIDVDTSIAVVQGNAFSYQIDVTGENGVCKIYFSGSALFDDVVAVMIDNNVVLNISSDGNYEITIPEGSETLWFFRNAAHVTGTGTVTLKVMCDGGITKELNDRIDDIETEIDEVSDIATANKNTLNGLSGEDEISVVAGTEFDHTIHAEGLNGNRMKIVFSGMSLFGDVIAVYNDNTSTPVLTIGEDGTYEVEIKDAEIVKFFRNAAYVTGTGTVTIGYEALYDGVVKKVNNLDVELNGYHSENQINVTAGNAFSFYLDTTGLNGKEIVIVFNGMSLFGDVVAVYNDNTGIPALEIGEDGTYSVVATDWNKIWFFRNAVYVTGTGTVTIGASILGIADNNSDVVLTDDFLNSKTRNQKYLTRIAFLGDSLTANEIGGDIPTALDEGNTMRPMRLLYNNIPRRFYDRASWNKPIFRRLDNSDWIKSGFSVLTGEQLFWGTEEVYHTAQSADAYAQITIPDGYEHFAIICRTKSGFGGLNVRINNEFPSSITYSNPIIDDAAVTGSINGNPKSTLVQKLNNNENVNTSDCPIALPCGSDSINLNIGVGQGNPYAIYEYNNLPSGDNVVKISSVDATRVDVWGIFYWSGNSMVVMNMGYGGHSTTSLLSVYRDVVFNNNVHFDGVIFELPIMNDTTPEKVGNVQITKSNTQLLMYNLEKYHNDVLYTTCHPFGMSIVHDTNFYALYTNPTMEQVSEGVRSVIISNKKPFIDLFRIFKKLIISKGGTLEGGESGLWYTWDGQHENLACTEIWFNNLWSRLKDKPLMLD